MSKRICKNCGAPITSEVCPYCHNKTGMTKDEGLKDIPTIECKEVVISFWTILFPGIFAFAFGFAGFGMPFIFLNSPGGDFGPAMILFFIPFMAVSVGAFVFLITPFVRLFKVHFFGREIEGTVHSYCNDVVNFNDVPGQTVRILLDTDEGPRYIKYQLGGINHPYEIDSKIKLKVYKNIFRIVEKEKYYFDGK